MEITKNTKLFTILEKYGDVPAVLKAFDIESFSKYSYRGVVTRFVTVELAAKKHKLPLDELLATLNKAVEAEVENPIE